MKRVLAIILVAGLSLSALVGCGSDKAAQEPTEGESKTTGEEIGSNEKQQEEKGGGETLRIMMSSGDFGADTIKPAFEKAAEIMGITIEYDVIPDDQMLNVANTQLATGNADDIILHNFGLSDVSAKDLAPLEGEWTDKITSTTKPLCVDEGGNVLKAPLGGESNMGLLYNKKVLEASGVTMPLKNYSEFVEACEKIKEAGYTPVYISNKEVWTAQILLMTSMTSVFADDAELIEKIVTNQVKPQEVPELVKLWENAVSLKDLGYINSDYMSATNDMAFEALANGECAFYAQMDNAYGTLAGSYPDQVADIGMAYTPLWDDEAKGYVLFDSATNYLSAVAASANVELAKEFINTVLTQDVLTVYYDANPGSVPYNDLGFELNTNPFNKEMRQYAETMACYGTFNNNSYNGSTPLEAFYGAFNEQIQGLYSGKSVEEAMDSWYDAYSSDAKARRVEGF